MLPLDDEAREISAQYDWVPTAGLDEVSQNNSYQQQLLVQLSNMKNEAASARPVEGMAELMKALAEMMQLQRELLGRSPAAASPLAGRLKA